jgi:hypothetical protein
METDEIIINGRIISFVIDDNLKDMEAYLNKKPIDIESLATLINEMNFFKSLREDMKIRLSTDTYYLFKTLRDYENGSIWHKAATATWR